MYHSLPILDSFPFAGIYLCVDLYAVFRPEPMHIFSLGIGKLIKKDFIHMLDDFELVPNAMKNGQHIAILEKHLRNCVPHRFNAILKNEVSIFSGDKRRSGFSKTKTRSYTTGVFSEYGLLGMLDAPGHEVIDQVLSLIGEHCRHDLWQ